MVTQRNSFKQMAVVTQFNQLQFDCTVEEIVLLGRTPHSSFTEGKERLCPRSRCSRQSDMLEKKTRLACLFLFQVGISESCRAWQEPTLLFDEPTNHLDIEYQLDLLAIVKNLKVNVLALSYMIFNLLVAIRDYSYSMKEEKSLTQGTPKETITWFIANCIRSSKSQVTCRGSAMIHYL